MSLLARTLKSSVAFALQQEIDMFKVSDRAKSLDEKTFNPLFPDSCFLGQTGSDISNNTYRSNIGMVPHWLGLGKYNSMTPLEVWSAYHWLIDREKVLKVLRYIKGESGMLPDLNWDGEAIERPFTGHF
jgi:hypothetical protein